MTAGFIKPHECLKCSCMQKEAAVYGSQWGEFGLSVKVMHYSSTVTQAPSVPQGMKLKMPIMLGHVDMQSVWYIPESFNAFWSRNSAHHIIQGQELPLELPLCQKGQIKQARAFISITLRPVNLYYV